MICTDLLKEGTEKGFVHPTNLTKKLNISGKTDTYPVYKIRLDALYYNDQNDRIATWISKEKENVIQKLKDDRAEYNDLIESFIIQSNEEAIKKTKNNIDLIGQQESGVVLSDGRIVDGNRRFTCLRLLNKEDIRKGAYFEAVILPSSISNDEKSIKMLELAIQHGEDSKVDYNPIDRLVGIYNDIIKNRLLSIHEYAQITNETDAEIKKKVELAELMVEYLDFIGSPQQFYIAREEELDGPLHEIMGALRRCDDEDKKDKHKKIMFNMLVNKPDNDMTRYIRSIKTDVINTAQENSYIDEQMECVEQTQAELIDMDQSGTEAREKISKVRSNEKVRNTIKQSREKAIEKTKREQIKNRPLELIIKGLTVIEDIDDYNIFQKLSSDQKNEILKKLAVLENKIEEIRKNIDIG